MSLLNHLHDPILGYAYELPVSLPCGHTVDVSAAVRTLSCPFDRTPFKHQKLRTNYSIQEGLDQFRKPQTTTKITFFFQNRKLRFVQKGSTAAPFKETEWKRAEETYAWMYQQLPSNYQTHLNTNLVIQGALEWNSQTKEYVYMLFSENNDLELTKLFQLTIKENWAKNFAGPYFASLKSK